MNEKEQKIIGEVAAIAKKIMTGNGKKFHDWDHVEDVVKNAEQLLNGYPEADAFAVLCAAYLHDIAAGEPEHNLAGAEKAGEILAGLSIEAPEIAKIQRIVKVHSIGEKAETLEEKIVADADHLDFANIKRIKKVMEKYSQERIDQEVKPLWFKLQKEILYLDQSKKIFHERLAAEKEEYEKIDPELLRGQL